MRASARPPPGADEKGEMRGGGGAGGGRGARLHNTRPFILTLELNCLPRSQESLRIA